MIAKKQFVPRIQETKTMTLSERTVFIKINYDRLHQGYPHKDPFILPFLLNI